MISIICAIADNYAIGKNNQLLWNIPEDLKRFREITSGKTVVMGRNTWFSLPEKFRPLPNRKNVVVTHVPEDVFPEGVEHFSSLDAALEAQDAIQETMVIGGGMIYKAALPKADRLYITHVHQSPEADVFFPIIETELWRETEREPHDGFDFVIYDRKK